MLNVCSYDQPGMLCSGDQSHTLGTCFKKLDFRGLNPICPGVIEGMATILVFQIPSLDLISVQLPWRLIAVSR